MNRQNSNDPLNWKQKYLQSLDELESRENNWQESETVLRQLISRLILAADTSHQRLNQQLGVLKNAMREGVSALKLKKAIEEISDSVSELEQLRTVDRSLETGRDLLNRLLTGLCRAEDQQKDIQKISKGLAKSSSMSDLENIIEKISNLYVKNSAAKDKQPGWLERLVAREKKPEAVADFEVVVEQPAKENSETVATHTVTDNNQVKQSLVNLIDRMMLPAALQVEANLIKSTAEKSQSFEELQSAMQQTVELIAELFSIARQERRNIEQFLHQLTFRLAEMDGDMKMNLSLLKEFDRNENHSYQDINREVNEIGQEANSAEDLESLKTGIQSRVIVMRNKLDTIIEQKEKIVQKRTSMLNKMAEKINQLEAETKLLNNELEKQKLEKYTDVITGLPNQYAFDEALDVQLQQAEKENSKAILMLMEIDQFEEINRGYSQAAGERVLKIIADRSREIAGQGRPVMKLSAGSFALLLNDGSEIDASRLAEKLLESVASCEFHFRDQRVMVTVSIGIVSAQAGENGLQLHQRAQAALQKAVISGRNRMEIV